MNSNENSRSYANDGTYSGTFLNLVAISVSARASNSNNAKYVFVIARTSEVLQGSLTSEASFRVPR